jgi:hypothetical protein
MFSVVVRLQLRRIGHVSKFGFTVQFPAVGTF